MTFSLFQLFTALPQEAFSLGSCSYYTERIIEVSLEYNYTRWRTKSFLTSFEAMGTLKMGFLPPAKRGGGFWETFPVPSGYEHRASSRQW